MDSEGQEETEPVESADRRLNFGRVYDAGLEAWASLEAAATGKPVIITSVSRSETEGFLQRLIEEAERNPPQGRRFTWRVFESPRFPVDTGLRLPPHGEALGDL